MERSAPSTPNLVRLALRALPPHASVCRQACGMLRPNVSNKQSVPLVGPRELLGSLTLVRVLVGENGEDVATSV